MIFTEQIVKERNLNRKVLEIATRRTNGTYELDNDTFFRVINGFDTDTNSSVYNPDLLTKFNEIKEYRVSICKSCEWNIDWICQHSGCLPCKQSQAGGLKAIIDNPSSRCSTGKW